MSSASIPVFIAENMYHKVIIVKISMKKVIAPIAQKCAGKVNETWPYISADNILKLVYFEIF